MRTNKNPQARQRPVILCVEDEVELRRDMAEELDEAGYAVIEAANGTEALAQIHAMRPDLIMCDINMPRANGYELLHTLRDQHPEYADIPFIFLTALADPREIVEGKRSGADDYLVKPVDFDLMLATIEARLRQVDRIMVQRDAELDRVRAALRGQSSNERQDWNNGIEQTLDLVTTGIILIEGRGNVCLANRAARDIAANTLECRIGEPLRTLAATHRDRLKAVMDRILAGAHELEDNVVSCALPRDPGQRDLMLVACTLPAADQMQASGPVAALFLTDPDKRPRVSATTLASLFGLTPTEAEIALELADGKKPADIGTSLGVAQTTIAFHMRNLFQKTNTNRQAELVALLLAGPLALTPHG